MIISSRKIEVSSYQEYANLLGEDYNATRNFAVNAYTPWKGVEFLYIDEKDVDFMKEISGEIRHKRLEGYIPTSIFEQVIDQYLDAGERAFLPSMEEDIRRANEVLPVVRKRPSSRDGKKELNNIIETERVRLVYSPAYENISGAGNMRWMSIGSSYTISEAARKIRVRQESLVSYNIDNPSDREEIITYIHQVTEDFTGVELYDIQFGQRDASRTLSSVQWPIQVTLVARRGKDREKMALPVFMNKQLKVNFPFCVQARKHRLSDAIVVWARKINLPMKTLIDGDTENRGRWRWLYYSKSMTLELWLERREEYDY